MVIAVYKDFDGKIKRGVAYNIYHALSLYHTFFDPGILVPMKGGGMKVIPGPRQTLLYIFKKKL